MARAISGMFVLSSVSLAMYTNPPTGTRIANHAPCKLYHSAERGSLHGPDADRRATHSSQAIMPDPDSRFFVCDPAAGARLMR